MMWRVGICMIVAVAAAVVFAVGCGSLAPTSSSTPIPVEIPSGANAESQFSAAAFGETALQ